MPRLTREVWTTIRAEWETGSTPEKLGKKHGCSGRAIRQRARSEKWERLQGVQELVKKRAYDKIRSSPEHSPEKVEEAIEERVDKTVEVIQRHREEINAVRGLMYAGIREHKQAKTMTEKQIAFETLKAAKITSETVRNMHVSERKAWNLDVPNDEDQTDIIIERSYGL